MEDIMTTAAPEIVADENAAVSLRDVEPELSRRMKLIQGSTHAPVLRARMSNLVIYCDRAELADAIAEQVPSVVAIHPARVLLAVTDPASDNGELTTLVRVRAHATTEGRIVCSEQVTLRSGAKGTGRLPFAVRGLLIGDLPTNLWWATPRPPPLAGAMLYELAEHAQQIIYDSIGWLEPARGVAATGAWLQRMEQGEGPWRLVSDLNWRRLKYWRRLLAQAFDADVAAGAFDTISEVLVEHGPHAVVQAWEIVSWLAARLGWRIEEGRVEPGVEIGWQFTSAQGHVQVCIRRLAEGPPEIRRLVVACRLEGKPRALNLIVQDEHHLAMVPDDGGAPRTVTVQPQPLAELIGRQLSDRAPDPVFRESMAVARILAESVLG
jgi:glucose-6-phosphate dehydrogenase assembly protein OpcA